MKLSARKEVAKKRAAKKKSNWGKSEEEFSLKTSCNNKN